MEYTVKKLAELAGVSSRTLRYYDEIGLLKPERINSSGYRIYGQTQVNLLQQILFYRELEVDLETIMTLVTADSFHSETELQKHRENLIKKRDRLNQIIETVERTIQSEKGVLTMSDEEKFNAFKEKAISDNEDAYGKEIRAAYGEQAIIASQAKWRRMSQADYSAMQAKEQEVFSLLQEAVGTKDPHSCASVKLANAHKEWLMYSWSHYSEEAHCGLADMYAADDRFSSYYNNIVPDGAAFLRDAIKATFN